MRDQKRSDDWNLLLDGVAFDATASSARNARTGKRLRYPMLSYFSIQNKIVSFMFSLILIRHVHQLIST